jgi:Homeodomain-like domain
LYFLPLPQGQGSLRPVLAILYQDLLRDARFRQLLLEFDADLAATARAGGCLICRSVVHSARYRRKLRGPLGRRLNEEQSWRFSFCCSRDGCRARKTPPSLRFLGRKVHLAAMVVLVAAIQHGATAVRVQRLSEMFGVSRRTVERWRTWWLTTFAADRFWQAARALFMPSQQRSRFGLKPPI